MKVCAVVVSAGKGERMGSKIAKPFLMLEDLPVLVYPLKTLTQSKLVETIILVTGVLDIEYCRTTIVEQYNLTKISKIVQGGVQRQDSVLEGLKQIPDDCDLVLIQDGVRPFITLEMIEQSIKDAWQYGAAIVGVPAKDTIKSADDKGIVTETLNRQELWLIQTPQVFKKDIILSAYRFAYQKGFFATDDSKLVEQIGLPVKLVMGSYKNIKITTPDDLVIAKAILQQGGK